MKFKDVMSRIAGSVVGFFTGIAAGFIPGYYAFIQHGGGSFADGILYLLSLPIFIVYEAGRGAYFGGKYGLKAGAIYPKTLNDELSEVSPRYFAPAYEESTTTIARAMGGMSELDKINLMHDIDKIVMNSDTAKISLQADQRDEAINDIGEAPKFRVG